MSNVEELSSPPEHMFLVDTVKLHSISNPWPEVDVLLPVEYLILTLLLGMVSVIVLVELRGRLTEEP